MGMYVRLLGVLAVAVLLPSCGGGGGGGGGGLPAVTGLKVVAGPGRVEMSWVPVVGASDYRIQFNGPGIAKRRPLAAKASGTSIRSAGRVAVVVRDLPVGTDSFTVLPLDGNSPGAGSLAVNAPLLQVVATPSGGAAGDRLGWSVAMLGDLDGDGRDDYIAGGMTANEGIVDDVGIVHVYSGATGVVLYTKKGTVVEEHLGISVGRAGDVDGDGICDFMAGATGKNGGGGAAWIWSGVDGTLIRRHDAAADDFDFGYAVSSAGDVNGDGRDDVIVGSPRSLNPMNYQVGKAYVYSGLDGSLLWTFMGEAENDRLGASVAGGADFNADGRGDVVIGAPGANAPSVISATGAVYVHSGLDGSLLFKRSGPPNFSDFELGVSVAIAGDVNADGSPDFLAGAPGGHYGNLGDVGLTRVYSGLDGAILLEIPGMNPNASFGEAVAAAGDVDGDGYADVVAAVVHGPAGSATPSQGIRVHSGADGSLIYEIYGGQSTGFGFSVGGGGDVDGDGRNDFMVGSYNESIGGLAQSGAVYVFADSQDLGIVDGEGMTPFGPSGYAATRLPQVAASGTWSFATAGGTGPFTWSLIRNRSGGTIDATSGSYTAGAVGNVVDLVRVVDTDGRSRDTRVLVGAATAPLARPVSLRAILVAADQVDLTWTDASSGESGFRIEYRTPTNPWATLTDVGAGATSYAATGLDVDKVYFFRLRAFDATSDSPCSPAVMANLPAPTALTALTTGGGTGAALSWTDQSTGETGFDVEMKIMDSGAWVPLVSLPADTESYAVTGLDPLYSYYFRVRALANVIESAWSNIAP